MVRMNTGLCYFTPSRRRGGPEVMVLTHDVELSLDAPKSNLAKVQPVFIHTIERCSIPAHKLCLKLRVSTLGTICHGTPEDELRHGTALKPGEATARGDP